LEQLVNDKVGSGQYATAGDVVSEGLWLLRERDEEIDYLRQAIREANEAFERREFTEYTIDNIHELAERINARGRKRLEDEARTGTG
jgi:Arc/MetJ-type ribon-helix-helix transcriptional regulator